MSFFKTTYWFPLINVSLYYSCHSKVVFNKNSFASWPLHWKPFWPKLASTHLRPINFVNFGNFSSQLPALTVPSRSMSTNFRWQTVSQHPCVRCQFFTWNLYRLIQPQCSKNSIDFSQTSNLHISRTTDYNSSIMISVAFSTLIKLP